MSMFTLKSDGSYNFMSVDLGLFYIRDDYDRFVYMSNVNTK